MLAQFIGVEEGHLRGDILAEFLHDARAGPLERLAHDLRLGIAALAKRLDGLLGLVSRALLEHRAQRVDIRRHRLVEVRAHRCGQCVAGGVGEGVVQVRFEPREGFTRCLCAFGRQLRPLLRVLPAGADGDDLLVESGGAAAIQREAAKQDDACVLIAAGCEAGTGEVVVHEALRKEASEQALHHAVLEVEVHGRLIERRLRLEHDRADRRRPAPPEVAFAVLRRGAQGVEGVRPVGCATARRFERREFEGCGAGGELGLLEARVLQKLERAAHGVAQSGVVESECFLRLLEIAFEGVDLVLEFGGALAARLELGLDFRLCGGVGLVVLEFLREGLDLALAARDARLDEARELGRKHGADRAELFVDALRLVDQHLEHAVGRALLEEEVVAIDGRLRLELSVDAAVALLEA